MIDIEKLINGDIFESGLKMYMDGFEAEIISTILSNVINREKCANKKLLMTVQKEAILHIKKGCTDEELLLLITSYVDIHSKEVIQIYLNKDPTIGIYSLLMQNNSVLIV
jgi:hypothetical protein